MRPLELRSGIFSKIRLINMWTNRTRLEHNTLNSQNTGRNNRKSKAKLDLPNETCNGTVDNISLKLSLKCNGEEKVINFNNNFEYNMQIKILKKKKPKKSLFRMNILFFLTLSNLVVQLNFQVSSNSILWNKFHNFLVLILYFLQ